jgi:hypothetical protein
VSSQLPLLSLHESIGYGDAYILDSVETFRGTGILYPAFGPDHLLPAIYSPLMYGALALAQIVAPSENPYFGPRLLELIWFFACAAAAGLLATQLVPGKKVFVGGTLLTLSLWMITPWVMQLRADFPAICCSLLTLYFLLSGKPRDVMWAGVCAGFAMQFKLTFVAALAAGGLWLILHRRWSDLLRFWLPAAICSPGLYAVAWWREPRMLQNILAMRQIIPHPPGVWAFASWMFLEPVFCLAMIALLFLLPSIVKGRKSRWQLLVLFFVFSLGLNMFAVLQAGGGMNYFYETMIASTPFALLTLVERQTKPWRGVRLLPALVLLILGTPYFAYSTAHMGHLDVTVAQRNWDYEHLRTALEGANVFSSIPDIARLRPERPVMDPLLLNYLSITGTADLSGLAARIERREFDVVVTSPGDNAWRGVSHLAKALRLAILDAYQPRCFLGRNVYLFPKTQETAPASSDLERRLTDLGCQAIVCPPGVKCLDLSERYDQFLAGPPTF